MKKILSFALLIVVFSSFILPAHLKKEIQEETNILKKIAQANGFENWKNVNQIKFTFNVDRDTTHFERTWSWKPKTNDITATSVNAHIEYNWASMDSLAHKTNASFINDKFWLLLPYQLVWDADNLNHTHLKEAQAPISKKTMQKLTIVYGLKGGYTPGDAYDLYFGDDYIIKEWVFRKSNQAEASLSTSFEEYKTINGLNIATLHKTANENFKLYFTEIEVK